MGHRQGIVKADPSVWSCLCGNSLATLESKSKFPMVSEKSRGGSMFLEIVTE